MKKNFTKKLTFNKATIASLDSESQDNLKGGATKNNCGESYTCGESYCPFTICDSVEACICQPVDFFMCELKFVY